MAQKNCITEVVMVFFCVYQHRHSMASYISWPGSNDPCRWLRFVSEADAEAEAKPGRFSRLTATLRWRAVSARELPQLLASSSKLVSNAWHSIFQIQMVRLLQGVALNSLRLGSLRFRLLWFGSRPAIKYRFFALLQLQLRMQQLWARFDSIRVQGYWVKLQISRLQVDSEWHYCVSAHCTLTTDKATERQTDMDVCIG